MPETIDRYEVLQKLASGGMAELFLAKQSGMEGFEKVVVIKRILPHLATDQEFVSMFLDEARIAAKLSHPNVVQIYDLGRADDTFYIAMEYVSGRNVSAVIKKARDRKGLVPVEHVARVVAGVCDGLFYAHTRKDYDGKALNIIHRDISPQNILVSFAGGVKLVDFGIAKASTQLAQTRAGVLKGKYSYMSPEQVKGDKIDGRSDIFAVGICMYEMLTGQRPFERDNSLKTLKAIVQEKPLNPRDLNPSVPPEIVKVLSKSLEKDPNRRYANAQEMQLALEDWLDRSPNKSNNVRISRYLYDLFDDELNSEGGTLEVKGIGEIIIPTGTNGAPPPDSDAPAEEVPEGTLRAALEEVEAAHNRKVAERDAAERAPTPPPPAPPAAKAAPTPAPKAAAAASPKAAGAPAPKAAAAAPPPKGASSPEDFEEGTDPSLAHPEEAMGGASEEIDGATIPVFDLNAYEQERARRHGEPGTTPNGEALPEDDPDGGFDDAATINMDAAQRAGLLDAAAKAAAAKAQPTRVRTETVDPPRRTSGPLEPVRTNITAPPVPPTPVAPPPPTPVAPPIAPPIAPPLAPPVAPPVASRAAPPVLSPVRPGLAASPTAPATPRAVAPPPAPPPPVVDDEVVPGIGGGAIRPAAAPGGIKPAAVARGGVTSTDREMPAAQIPVPAGNRPVREQSAAFPAVVDRPLNGKSPHKGAPPVATPVRLPLANAPTEAPDAPPEPTAAPAAPAAPAGPSWLARNRYTVIVALSAVVGLILAVAIVVNMAGSGPEAQVVENPKDPGTAGTVPSGDTGKVKVTSTPSKCEFMVNGVKSELVTPAMVQDVPAGDVTVRVLGKDGFADKIISVKLEKDKRVDVNAVLDKKP